MNSLDRHRWNQLGREIGASADVSLWFDRLEQLYAQPHRHYHNGRHIAECLREFDSASSLAQQPAAVELAIWFHDAIYDPRAADNEEQSAALARQCLGEMGLDHAMGEPVSQLIMATKQHDGSLHIDAPLLVDVDLSILGQPPARFWEYEDQIRGEYGWVPQDIFTTKRAEILKRFLARKRLYHTPHFFQKYEAQARLNLEASVQKLNNIS